MCQNAVSIVASLGAELEPDVIDFLNVLGVANSPNGQSAITALNALLVALNNWKSGTSAAVAISAITAFTDVFNTLPIPADAKGIADAISAAIVVLIGVLKGNSPAPAPDPVAERVTATPEELQAAHQAEVASDTEQQVQKLLPGFKRSKFHSVVHQWQTAWKQQVEAAAKVNPKYKTLAA